MSPALHQQTFKRGHDRVAIDAGGNVLTDWFNAFLGLVLRLALLLAGLVFVATILMLACLMLVLWLLRAAWAKLTGRPVSPWTFEMHRKANWHRFYRGQHTGEPTPPQGGPQSAMDPKNADVVDVEIKRLDEPGQRH